MVFYSGLWLILLIALPFFLLELLFRGAIAGLAKLWRWWRPRPPKPEPASLPADLPWPRRSSFGIGFLPGAACGALSMPPLWDVPGRVVQGRASARLRLHLSTGDRPNRAR